MSASYWTSTQRNIWTFSKQELARERNKLLILETQTFPEGLTVPMVNNSQNSSALNGTASNGIGDNKMPSGKNNTSNDQGSSGTNNGRIVSKHVSIYSKDLHYDRDYSLRIYCYFLVMKLGRRLNLRQQALATTNIYLSRFLLRASVREVNLYLLVTTCIYLACKVEECPLHIRSLVSEARAIWPEFISTDATKVTEFEFYLIEELGSYMIVYHPYQSLEQIMNTFNEKYGHSNNDLFGGSGNIELGKGEVVDNDIDMLTFNDNHVVTSIGSAESTKKAYISNTTPSSIESSGDLGDNGDEDFGGSYVIDAEVYQNTWSLINDSYITDVHLLYPPHVIAVSCLMMALSSSYTPSSNQQLKTKTKSPSPSKKTSARNKRVLRKLNEFLAESMIDLELVLQCSEELLNLYDHWEKYNEDWTRYLLYHVYLVKR